jgi:hypothetical protein
MLIMKIYATTYQLRIFRCYAPCLSSVFQIEFRDEKQKEFANAH